MTRVPNLSKALEDIRSVKVQGAERIALFFLDFIESLIKAKRNDANVEKLVSFAISQFLTVRPTEPCLRNVIKYVLLGTTPTAQSIERLLGRSAEAKVFLKRSGSLIAELGSHKIKNHSIVYTHCHSSSVIAVLHSAVQQKKTFFVRNTETRPLYQGRKTATELAKMGIPVEHYIDSAMRLAIKHADIVLLGADAITDEAIYNKIGSALVCEIANSFEIPVYICSTSWKYDPISKQGKEEKIEERSPKEVWIQKQKNITIKNPAFEKISPEHITGIISELGILPVPQFLSSVTEKYYWILR